MPTKKDTVTTKGKGAAKKAPAKKVAKKAAKKVVKKAPAAKKRAGKKELVYASNNQSFWVTNGQILNSLLALRDALGEMDKEVYHYHANGWQNDFAQWVDTVLCDTACAADLRKAKTAKSAKTVVVRHLKLYVV